MEDNESSSSNNKEDREPKKIALKVPSLFIKTTPTTSSESGSSKQNDGSASKKISRPMPASARKKLEESKNEEEKSVEKTNDSSSEISNGSGSSSQKNTTPRPMPASARRKLEEEKSSESTEPVTPVTNKEVKKPMPASMKRKLEEAAKTETKGSSSGSDTSSASKDTSTMEKKTASKPMPASARRKHEETKAEEKPVIRDDDDRSTTSGKGGRVSSIGSTTSSISKVSRPMPASARRKIEMEKESSEITANSPQSDENTPRIDTTKKSTSRPGPASAKRKAEESNNDGLGNSGDNSSDNAKKETDGKTVTAPKRPMPASARRKLEETSSSKDSNESKNTAVDSVDTAKPANKITISLDGIKFPKFNKPMPASAKRKVEDPEATTNKDRDDLNTSEQFETTINDGHKSDGADESQETGRTRRSGTSFKMLTSLITEKFPCQFCGQEFYKISSKNSHEKKVHLEKKEKDPDAEKVRKTGSSKSKSSKQKGRKYTDNKCPKCNIVIKNRKKLVNHVYKCGRPLAFSCQYCDKKFASRSKLSVHLNTHIKEISVEETSQDAPRRTSTSDYGSPVPSPMSVASNGGESKSSKESVVEKTKPIPDSVKAKLDLNDKSSSRNRTSFKRKIADVLSNLGSHNLSITTSTKNNESGEEAEQGPPSKKTILSDGPESIKGRPMPASVRKKLEQRSTPKESVSSSKIKKRSSETKEKFNKTVQSNSGGAKNANYQDTSDLDPCECEVCHRVFTQMSNRIRHEKTVHSILQPRNKTTPAVDSTKESESPTHALDSYEESESPTPPDFNSESMTQYTPDFDLNSLPVTGRCPICQQFKNRLRGHMKSSHKIGTYSAPVAKPSPVNEPATTRLTAPKSYKIYKSAAKKAMQKLTTTTSSSSSKPVVSSEKITVKAVSSLHQKTSSTKTEPGSEQSVSTNRCTCCDETFEFQGDFSKHMEMRHPNRKRVITCKLCRHLFSHEEDFIIHIRFKHKEIISGIEQTPDSHSKSKSPKVDPQQRAKSHSSTQQCTRSTRTSALASDRTIDHPQQSLASTPSKYEIEDSMKDCTVGISFKDRELAEKVQSAHKVESSVKTEQLGRSERSKRRSSLRVRTPSPEPEIMDTTYGSDHYDDDMEVDPDPIDGIAITSTFSQRPPSPKKNTLGLDEMPCSTCTEVFYSYEALRKHELYFHNVKTSKMCPICGVYPTRLGRHLLAHENKTVRCSCAPCRLSFQNFSELLKHNLSKHPGPDGGAQCAANKPRSVPNDPSTSTPTPTPNEIVQENKTVSISCKICSSSFNTMRQAKQHVWRVHPERTEDVEVYLENSCDNENKESSKKIDDTVVTIDSDDEDSRKESKKPTRPVPASVRAKLKEAMECDVENKPKPSRPMPASARAKLEKLNEVSDNDDGKPKSSRPMPASARAKLQSQKSVEYNSDENKADNTSKPSRPMPASARARLQDSFEVDSNVSDKSGAVTKPKRPMPASVKAKLQKSIEFGDKEGGDKEKPKPSRPMPASVRAKMSEKTSEASDSRSGSMLSISMSVLAGPSKPRGPMPASVRAKLMRENHVIKTDHDGVNENDFAPDDLDDDRDDIPSDVEQDNNEQQSFVEGPVGKVTSQEEIHDDDEYIPEPPPHSIPTFSIADEIAEHDRAVRMAMGEDVPTSHECKVCNKKFESIDSIRRHIRRGHREYGSEQIDDLIESGYASAGHSLRARKSNVRYNYNEDEEEEDEEVIPVKSKKPSQGLNSSVSNNPDVPDNCAFACKFCRKRCTSIANVKRHIGQSHRHISAEDRNNGVLFIQDDGNLYFNGESAWTGETSKDDVPLFSCTYCSYKSTDEDEYVRHHKTHTGESPYVCQYCSARFPRSQKLEAHVQREHSGAEILNSEEPEICMEDMVAVAQISVSTSSRIQIDSPQAVSLDRRFSHESNGHSNDKRTSVGPKSTKAATKEVDPMLAATSADGDEDSSSPGKHKDDEGSSQAAKDPVGFTYQTDLSSLFPSLREAPSGLDALDDIDGGMSLD